MSTVLVETLLILKEANSLHREPVGIPSQSKGWHGQKLHCKKELYDQTSHQQVLLS